ncbi:glycosyltransferase [Algoriphagus aestuarii]|nr:glycosyltransferase [Algoriphagus aestuarii]
MKPFRTELPALILVTFNRAYLLEKILKSIHSFSWNYSCFIVVNNACSDSTSDILEEYKDKLNLEIITLAENIGHGAGLAKAMQSIVDKGEVPKHLVFLEDDSIPQKEYLDFLVQAAQNRKYTLISSGGYLVKLGKRIKIHPKGNEILPADFGLFDGAIARFEDLIKVGYPIENWFMMFDDFEYCYRIKKSGFQIGVLKNPYVEIRHEGWGGGTSHSHLWRSYYQSRNFVLFLKMHFTWFYFWDFLILQSKRLLGGIVAPNSLHVSKMRLMGIRAGLIGKTGKSLNLNTLKEN